MICSRLHEDDGGMLRITFAFYKIKRLPTCLQNVRQALVFWQSVFKKMFNIFLENVQRAFKYYCVKFFLDIYKHL